MHPVRIYIMEGVDLMGEILFRKKVLPVKEKYLTMGDLFSRISKVIVK